jgi:tetratricopeptide (TPR) repeat protein
MATDPEAPGQQKLDFEKEEANILQATRGLAMTLRVEESGSLQGLQQIWQRRADFDVLHLSGHANIAERTTASGDKTYVPYFVVESETGAREQATATQIAAVIRFRMPRLVFLSGCRTGESGGQGATPSLAEQLIAEGVPAVLGWGRPVGDRVATIAATVLYEKLAAGYRLVEALAFTYQAVMQDKALHPVERQQWQLLRLYAQSHAVGQLVPRLGEAVIAEAPPMEDLFLDAEQRVRVASAAQFVGRRRNLQRCLRELKLPKLGVMLHGLGGVGKSTVAKRLLERLTGYTPIVIYRQLDELALLSELERQCMSERGHEILNGKLPLSQRLARFFQEGLNERDQRFAIVLDDFEVNLEDRGDGQWVMQPAVVPVVQGLLEGIERSQRSHRVLITSRYEFGLPQRVQSKVHREPLAGLRDGDLKKKCDRLAAFSSAAIDQVLRERAIALSDGNPRLLEALDLVLRDAETDQAAILAAMARATVAFREAVLVAQLLAQQSSALRAMLSRGLILELPVAAAIFAEVAGASADEIGRAVSIGLLEVFPHGELRVPRIVDLKIPQVEELAEKAAQVLYRVWWEEANESSTEAQRLEIHRLALLGKVAAIAGEIGDQLASQWIDQSRFREAVQLCKSTLEVTEDFRIRHELARAEAPLGETKQAIADYQKALADCPDSEDRTILREKAAIIHNLAGTYAQQGQVSEAIALYQQSLELDEQIGNVQGKAATLRGMAGIYEQQGQVSEAIALYQQSLELDEQIGNVRGKAETLKMMGQLLAAAGDFDTAIAHLQESLAILQRIQSWQAQTVQEILSEIIRNKPM